MNTGRNGPNILEPLDFKKICHLALWYSIAIFVILFFSFDMTFLADDYVYLADAVSPSGIGLERFGSYWTRVPVLVAMIWAIFKSKIFEVTWAPMIFFFMAYAWAFVLFVRYVFHACGEKYSDTSHPRWLSWSMVLLLGAYILYPTFYEVLYWPTDMGYAVGALFLAGALTIGRLPRKIALMTLSFLVSEMFILPAFFFLVFPVGYKWIKQELSDESADKRSEIVKAGMLWVPALILFFGVRLFFRIWFPSYTYGLSLNLSHIGSQMIDSFFVLASLHFYRVFWVQTVVYWLILITLIVVGVRRQTLYRGGWIWFAACIIFSASIYWVIDYSARRALFGANLFVNALFVWLFAKILISWKQKAGLFLMGLLVMAFMTHLLLIFSVKDGNVDVLNLKEADLVQQMTACKDPCIITVSDLDHGFDRDWVLPRDYWTSYLNWVKGKYFPDKAITFQIRE